MSIDVEIGKRIRQRREELGMARSKKILCRKHKFRENPALFRDRIRIFGNKKPRNISEVF